MLVLKVLKVLKVLGLKVPRGAKRAGPHDTVSTRSTRTCSTHPHL